MCQKLKTWICFLLSLWWAFSSGGVHGLSCHFCQPATNYSSCLNHGSPVECTEALVNVTHLLLSPHNPTVRSVSPMREFQCFHVNYTVKGVMNYQMGCTFAGSHLCEGWTVMSQCKIINGMTTKTPQDYGTPTIPSAGPNISTTPRGNNVSDYSSSISTTTKVPPIMPASGSTTQVITTTTGAEGSTVAPDRTRSRANVVSLRIDLLVTLILLHSWCQHL